ncbi:eukaryotic translation initiation factor 2-alpha kinase [Marasmius crinis-equi]|uniref:Eukaryotic translation initiation factor 2-alpha kinase n=1 Tax=Marasmius crinis-equi TaxID=585013 RepID=A0ABR3F0Z9_9AGAR
MLDNLDGRSIASLSRGSFPGIHFNRSLNNAGRREEDMDSGSDVVEGMEGLFEDMALEMARSGSGSGSGSGVSGMGMRNGKTMAIPIPRIEEPATVHVPLMQRMLYVQMEFVERQMLK